MCRPVIDQTTVDIAVFEASALLAGLQVPIIAVLLEFYGRTQQTRYMNGVKLSAVSSLIFLAVAVASLVLLLQAIWTPYPATSYLILVLMVAAIVLIATVLMMAGLNISFDAPVLPKVEPIKEPATPPKQPETRY